MKAVIWEGVNSLRYTENAPEPEAMPGWVKIKVRSVGVCATDTHIITGRFYNGDPPHILGHEICGDVVELGEGVTGLRNGDRVVVETAVSCGKCIHCLTANKHLCDEGAEIGFPPYQGGYAEYVVAPASCVHRIPDSMSYNEGGILEACVCPFGAIYRLGMNVGETVLIQGTGVAGLAFIQSVKLHSPKKIIVAARNPERLEQAKRFGADVAINSAKEDLFARVMEETDGQGATLSIEAAGAPVTLENAVKLTAKGGRCILYGLPGENDNIQFPVKDIIMKQLTVFGVTNNELAWDPLIELVAAGKFNVKDMVTHHFTLDRLEDAVKLVIEHPAGLIKAVIEVSG